MSLPVGVFCVWIDSGDRWVCSQCRAAVMKSASVTEPFSGCKVGMRDAGVTVGDITSPNQRSIPDNGPGTELKMLLKNWLGITTSSGCSCNSMAGEMNAMGSDWCESPAGLSKIKRVMKAEHEKRVKSGSTRLPWTDFGAERLIRLACWRARRKAWKTTTSK